MADTDTDTTSNELRHSIYLLRTLMKRAGVRDLPAITVEFKTHEDRSRFIMEFEATLKPSQFEEGRRWGEKTGDIFITPINTPLRLVVTP